MQRQIFCFSYQHLKNSRFYGAEPPACILRIPLAIESNTGPQADRFSILYPLEGKVKRFSAFPYAMALEGGAASGEPIPDGFALSCCAGASLLWRMISAERGIAENWCIKMLDFYGLFPV